MDSEWLSTEKGHEELPVQLQMQPTNIAANDPIRCTNCEDIWGNNTHIQNDDVDDSFIKWQIQICTKKVWLIVYNIHMQYY